MENKNTPILDFLFKYLKASKIQSHQVINHPKNIQDSSQFLSIDGIVSTILLEGLFKCLIEKGLRKWISNESRSTELEIEKKVKSQCANIFTEIELFFKEGISNVKSGGDYYLPIFDFQDDEYGLFKGTPKITTLNALKNLIIDCAEDIWEEERIINEIKIRRKISRKKKGMTAFIEKGDEKLFLDFFYFLEKNNYVKSNFADFRNLFSGIPPEEKVIFKDANILNHIKLFLWKKGFRKSPTYSLKSNFSPYINFFTERSRVNIEKDLFNVSKNNSRYQNMSLEKEFEGYLEK